MTQKWKYLRTSPVFIGLLLNAVILWLSCENPITSPGPQPNFIEKVDGKPLLNVLGVLRPDLQGNISKSFVHVETTASVTDEFPDSLNINDAEVMIFTYENNTVADSFRFNFTAFDSVFSSPEYRSTRFYPEPLKKYGLKCQYPGYLTLTATTVVPSVPALLNNSLTVGNHDLRFKIKRDSLAVVYEIHLWVGAESFEIKVLRPETGDIAVVLPIGKSLAGEAILVVYAYDENLGNYLTTNLTIKPNTYLPSFSTVENGCGCFGSLNMLVKELVF